MKRQHKYRYFVMLGAAIGFLMIVTSALAASVGQSLANVSIKDANDKPATIPDFGKKVLFIVYADSQTADDNDPLAEAIRKRKFDTAKYRGMGVANLADSWAPDFVIRMVIRRKIEQFNKTILTDDNHTLARMWKLGDCDDVSVVMVIGKDKKLKYLKRGKVRGEEIDKVIQIIAEAIAEP
jgi:predicted transcriptional regulator